MNRREKDITLLYLATLGRMPDREGLEYWVDSDMTISQIAKSFFAQPEAKRLYPPNSGTDYFIKSVYKNLLGREPDSDGLNYWHNELVSGKISRDMFILSVIYGANDEDKKILDDRLNNPFEDRYTQYDSSNIATYKDKINRVSNVNDRLDMDALSTTSKDAQAILQDSYWKKDTVTYTFNKYIPQVYYKYGDKYTDGWRPFTLHEQALVRKIFRDIEKFTNLKFKEVPSNGDIRFNHVNMDDNRDGFAKTPYNTELGGDIWISNFIPKDGDAPGTGRYYTLLHEIGHALGLKHSFTGYPVLPPYKDDSNHTVMSYTFIGDKVLEPNHDKSDLYHDFAFYRYALPKGYEVYDIEALQSLYGVNQSGANIGNTVYKLSSLYDDKDHAVIWDTSGIDLIDLSHTNYPDYIDLRDGYLSSVDVHSLTVQMEQAVKHFIDKGYIEDSARAWAKQIFIDSSNHDRIYTGLNNLSIAKGTIIENIITGSANDVVVDNEYNNIIILGDGDDRVYIRGGGFDQINGGDGFDSLYFQFPSSKAEVKRLSDGRYIVDASDSEDTFVIVESVEMIGFSDIVMELV